MTSFNFSGEHVSIRDERDNIAVFNPLEALDLLQWLSDKREIFLSLAQQAADRGQSPAEFMAAISSLPQYRPSATVAGPRLEEVTERALALLKELQAEYWVHPMLEDTDVFAQA
ncbi:MAG TPA: hypothetical protein VJ761_06665 [Ktedonobacteraceae bacterium]|nr:hypothetical protein [Ktedonobacteraceae bacterium]